MSEHSPDGPETPDGDSIAIKVNGALGALAGLETVDLLVSGKPLYALAGAAAVGLALWNDARMRRPQSEQQEQ